MANTDIITQAIQKAVDLRGDKDRVYAETAANRRFLRDADAQGLLTAEQSAWLAEHYTPRAPRGSNGTADLDDE